MTPRLQHAVTALTTDTLDAILIMSPAGAAYLSGCWMATQTLIPARQAFVLLTANGRSAYLVCNIEERQARAESWIDDVRVYVEFEQSPAAAAADLLAEFGLANGRIGVEMHTLPHDTMAALQTALPQATFTAWDDGLARLMMIKDDAEIAALEMAARRTQAAIETAFKAAKLGDTELDVSQTIFAALMQHGLQPMFNVFASGPRTLLVHGEPTERVMQPGDVIRLDVGGRFPDSYLSDMARTAVVGEPSAAQAELYDKLFRAQQAVIAAMQPGTAVADLFHICADSYRAQDIPFIMPHIGHGMGLGLHEEPIVHPGSSAKLATGMVLNIEPFLAVPEREESYHIEDLVLITADGPRLLSTPQPTLLQIAA